MTPDALAEKLRDLGLDPAELPHARVLCRQVLASWPASGGMPEHVWWVPGRIEVFGKHTDYAGGRSLVAAMPRGFIIAARPRPGRRVTLLDARRGETFEIDLDDAVPPVGGWRHYVEVVVHRFGRNFPHAGRGAAIVFASNLPRASGLSSSSALVVGVASALAEMWSLASRREWQANISSALDRAGYLACLENGLSFGSLRGDAGVGTHGGSEDHAAIVCGRAGHLSLFAFVPPRHLEDVPQPAGWRYVIASSGVTAEKTGAARSAYNRLSDGVRALLDYGNDAGPRRASLADLVRSGPDAVDRLTRLVRSGRDRTWAPDALERRLNHFVREDARVAEAATAFRAADAAAIGRLAAASQADAEALLGNQIQETIALASLARERGAFAASSFGAGFGGSVWALVPEERAADFASDWLTAYRRRFPAGERATAFTATPSIPLTNLL